MTKSHSNFLVYYRTARSDAPPRSAGMARLLKSILLSGCLAAAAATPSRAQSYDPSIGSGNIAVNYSQAAAPRLANGGGARMVRRVDPDARKAYARVSPDATMFKRNGGPADLLTDPDPNIRFQLQRESLQGRW